MQPNRIVYNYKPKDTTNIDPEEKDPFDNIHLLAKNARIPAIGGFICGLASFILIRKVLMTMNGNVINLLNTNSINQLIAGILLTISILLTSYSLSFILITTNQNNETKHKFELDKESFWKLTEGFSIFFAKPVVMTGLGIFIFIIPTLFPYFMLSNTIINATTIFILMLINLLNITGIAITSMFITVISFFFVLNSIPKK